MDGYSQFYRANRDRLYAYLLRMTGDRHVAVDLVQESFTRYLARYGGQAANRSLLYTIARNAALDTLRKLRMQPVAIDDPPAPQENPEQLVIEQQRVTRMLAAIGRLPPPDRELISLVASGDLTYREIGGILNISEANVKVRVHRARTRLREILASGECEWTT